MANFDAMIPLIPRDMRVPVDQERDQLRIKQVEKTKEVEKVSDEEANTISDNDPRRQSSQQQTPQQREGGDEDEEGPGDGHIDTYA